MEIKKEIEKFYFEHGFNPRYSDLSASSYLVKKYFGSLDLEIEKGEFKQVKFNHFSLDKYGKLENEISYFGLKHLRMPTIADCGQWPLSSYYVYLNNLGGFSSSTIFYDNLRAMISSKREILGIDKPTRFMDTDTLEPDEEVEYGIDYELMFELALARLAELKKDIIRDFKYGSIRIEYGYNEDWEYKLHRYQKYTEEEYILLFKEKYDKERFEVTEEVTKLW